MTIHPTVTHPGCRIVLMATGLVMMAGSLAAQIRPAFTPPVTRAVVVGISEYRDTTLGDLRFAHRDAEAFAAYLLSEAGGAIPAEHLRLLLNGDATHGNVVAALDWIQEETGPGERAILFFSGHGDAQSGGSRAGYLLCTDAVVRKYSMSGALALSALQEAITTMSVEKGGEVLFIADACRSGGLQDNAGIRVFGDGLARQYTHELKILSCQPHELSHEGPQWGGGQGAFTWHLLEGLLGLADQNGDELISLFELAAHVKQEVSLDMMPVRQVPLVRGDETRIIGRIHGPTLARLNREKGRELMTILPALPRSNKYDRLLAGTDSVTLDLYRAFRTALEEKRLLHPAGDCADHYYNLLVQDSSLAAIHADLQRDLVAHLQMDAQHALNQYLQLDIQQLSRSAHLLKEQFAGYPAYLERAAKLLGPHDPRTRTLNARRHLFEGMIMMYANRTRKDRETVDPIVQVLQTSLEEEHDNPIAAFFLMDVFAFRLMHYDSAHMYYNKAVELDPGWLAPHAWWGYYLSYFNRFDDAVAAIEKALVIDSTHNFTLKAKAGLLFFREQWESSMAVYYQALQYKPDDHISWLNIGACLQNLGRFDEALTAFETSLVLQPDQFTGYFMMGQALVGQGHFEAAEEVYAKAAEKDPTHIPLRYGLADLYVKSEKWNKLEEQCALLESLAPDTHFSSYFRACKAAAQNNEKQAFDWLNQALKISAATITECDCEPLKSWFVDKPAFRDLVKPYLSNNK